MAVLLEGVNIPEGNPITVNIYRNGTWVNAYTTEDGNAIEVPGPHGRLIEKNAVFELIQSMPSIDKLLPVEFMKALHEIPIVIPAEEGET